MKLKDERYFIDEELVIDIVAEPRKDDPMMDKIGLVFMGGERKTPGAKEGSDEEYSHEVKSIIEFKNKKNLENAQIGLKLLEDAIKEEQEC